MTFLKRIGHRQPCWHHAEAMHMWRAEMRPEAAAMDAAVKSALEALVAAEVAKLRGEIAAMKPAISHWRAFYTLDGSDPLLQFFASPTPLGIGEKARIDWTDSSGAPHKYEGTVTAHFLRNVVADAQTSNGTIGTGFIAEAVIMDNVAITREEAEAQMMARISDVRGGQ